MGRSGVLRGQNREPVPPARIVAQTLGVDVKKGSPPGVWHYTRLGSSGLGIKGYDLWTTRVDRCVASG